MKTESDSGEILPEATVIRGSVSDSLQLRVGESLKLGGNTDCIFALSRQGEILAA